MEASTNIGHTLRTTRPHLEDYKMNAKDDFEVRRKMFSRLPIEIIKMCRVFLYLIKCGTMEGASSMPMSKKEKKIYKSIGMTWISQN